MGTYLILRHCCVCENDYFRICGWRQRGDSSNSSCRFSSLPHTHDYLSYIITQSLYQINHNCSRGQLQRPKSFCRLLCGIGVVIGGLTFLLRRGRVLLPVVCSLGGILAKLGELELVKGSPSRFFQFERGLREFANGEHNRPVITADLPGAQELCELCCVFPYAQAIGVWQRGQLHNVVEL
jgi:hypothetical protein